MSIRELDYEKLGVKIREARKAKGYTQERLSELVSITPHFLSRVETNNKGVISLPTLVRICNALDVGMDYMLSDSLEAIGADAPGLDALIGNDKVFIAAVIREFVKYKSQLMIDLK